MSYSPGVNGSTFLFDGTTGFVDVTDNNELYPQAGSFSIVASVKSSAAAGVEEVVSKYECGGQCPGGRANSLYEIYLENGVAKADLRDTDAGTSAVQGTHLVADGQFHHLALVRDVLLGELRLYLDGALEASTLLAGGATGAIKDDDGWSDP